MQSIEQSFKVPFHYSVVFTEGLFEVNNPTLKNTVLKDGAHGIRKVYFAIDSEVHQTHSQLGAQIKTYMQSCSDIFDLCDEPIIIPGGEKAKNDILYVQQVLEAINKCNIDRHSYLVIIGGGSVLDAIGFAATIAHRGIRHIRVPTTVLAQNDAGIGVKNGINQFGKKNFIGCFAPPYAVINDSRFLTTLDDRDWRSGIAEAIKVALIKDKDFFQTIRDSTEALNRRDLTAMQKLIYRCAEMHLDHIASGDPFEMGSSRPLDFGHWAAHKLEHISGYTIRHGEAVAIGIALDVTYSYLKDMITETEHNEILNLFKSLGFQLYVPEMSLHLDHSDKSTNLIGGLQEFREHLGGDLTVMLLEGIGKGVEVNEMDQVTIIEAIDVLMAFESNHEKQV